MYTIVKSELSNVQLKKCHNKYFLDVTYKCIDLEKKVHERTVMNIPLPLYSYSCYFKPDSNKTNIVDYGLDHSIISGQIDAGYGYMKIDNLLQLQIVDKVIEK